MNERESLFPPVRYEAELLPTVRQAEKYLQLVKAGGVVAATVGIGSNGYPPSPGMKVLYEGNIVTIDADGKAS